MQEFRVITDMYHTIRKGTIVVGVELDTVVEHTPSGLRVYPEGYRIVGDKKVPWIFPRNHFEPIYVTGE